ncbi:Clp protease N-terminal domain-containing protein [Streptomyces naphthomycinicus]|uniref:Clp protease N-terminal domain-containing protein n=1 Tax=Streptomyces naphthomycinicus TaxID=2872625 RepID=UPI001CEDF4AB|nr:Clp protease N-terminal domain-containing protein [Streptomyces sp. TML10]
MQPRTAHRTAHDGVVPPPDGAAGLGAELAAVVAGARRRAVRDGDRQTDTAHLLHALLEDDPEVRAAVGGPARLARLLGYLVQRSIGYGLRWQASVEDSGALPRVPAPAGPDEQAGAAGNHSAAPTGPTAAAAVGQGGAARDGGSWSPAASAALADARARARRRGAPRVTGTDLLAALAADPRSRAVEVLERAGVPARELTARIESAAEEHAGDPEAVC